jgi:hypothetical protein
MILGIHAFNLNLNSGCRIARKEEPDDVEEVPGLWDYGSASGDYGGLCGENRPSHVYPIESRLLSGLSRLPGAMGLYNAIPDFPDVAGRTGAGTCGLSM